MEKVRNRISDHGIKTHVDCRAGVGWEGYSRWYLFEDPNRIRTESRWCHTLEISPFGVHLDRESSDRPNSSAIYSWMTLHGASLTRLVRYMSDLVESVTSRKVVSSNEEDSYINEMINKLEILGLCSDRENVSLDRANQ